MVILRLNNGEDVFLTSDQIKQNTSLDVTELELLIGSHIRVDFFKIGEELQNGIKCNKEKLLLKEYYITLQYPIDELKEKNKHLLKDFDVIKNVAVRQIKGVDKAVINTEVGNAHWVLCEHFCDYTKLDESEFHILKGSYVSVDYYKVGDSLKNGQLVYRDNIIIKEINIRFAGKYESMHKIFEESAYEGEHDDSFCRNDRYNEYGGPSDGYGGYLSDNFIRDVLDGEVDAYWNLD